MKGSWKGDSWKGDSMRGKSGKSVFTQKGAAAPAQDAGDEPPSKRRKKVERSLEDVRERLAASLEANVPGNFKPDLNTALMHLLRRPLAKGDIAVSLERGPPDVLQLTIPLLNLTMEQTFEENLKADTKKEAEQSLVGEAMRMILEGIDSGDILMPEEAAPPVDPNAPPPAPKGPSEVSDEDFKSQLNTALQKLLGRATSKEDRFFKVSILQGTGTCSLPTMNPPVNVSCSVDETEGYSSMSPNEKHKVHAYVEHQLAHMALQELEAAGRLVYDASQPVINRWQLGPNAKGGYDAKKRQLPTNPPPAPQHNSAKQVVDTDPSEPPLLRLRRLQDSFELQPPDEYSEHIVCQPGEHGTLVWHSTLTLCGPMTNGTPSEGHGESSSRPKAQEQAAAQLLSLLDGPSKGRGKGAAAAPKGAKGVGRQPLPGQPARPPQPPPPAGKGKAWPPAQKGSNGNGKGKGWW